MTFSFSPEEQAKHSTPEGGFNNPESVTTKGQNLMSRLDASKSSIIDTFAYLVAGAAVIVSIAFFAYQLYLSSAVQNKRNTISEYESKLGVFNLQDMRSLSKRMKFINQLVKEHPSANAMFRILEDSVENKITYGSADLAYDSTTKKYNLVLEGTSPDYKSLAQQIDTFKRKPYTNYLSSFKLKSVEPNSDGMVDFSISTEVAINGVLPEEMLFGDDGSNTNEFVSTSTTNISPGTQDSSVSSSSTNNNPQSINSSTTTVDIQKNNTQGPVFVAPVPNNP